jgi:hypothetical protein
MAAPSLRRCSVTTTREIVAYGVPAQSGVFARRGFLLTPDTPRGLPALALQINQDAFQLGQVLDTTLILSNPGAQRTVDMYVGIVFPDGAVWWVKDVNTFEGAWSDSLEADPRTCTPLWTGMTLMAGLQATWTDFIEHTWTGIEPQGIYHFVVGWTLPNSLEDGVIHKGDLVALDWKAFSVSGGGQAFVMNR